jgi:hypothetical protein
MKVTVIIATGILLMVTGQAFAQVDNDVANAQILCRQLMVLVNDKCDVQDHVLALRTSARIATVCLEAAPQGWVNRGSSTRQKQPNGTSSTYNSQGYWSNGACTKTRQFQFADICTEASGFQQANGLPFRATDWILKIYTQYSGDQPVATCQLSSH